MIMSSSPGILEGDEYRMAVDIGDGCDFTLETQSYQRLYTMKKEGASQHMNVRLGSNASFCYLPHPLVPHVHTNFKSSAKIYMGDNCTLVWGEVITCGRKLNNEQFQFTRLHLTTEVFKNDKLVLKENMFLEPALLDPLGMGLWEGYTHHATLLLIGKGIESAHLSNMIVELLAAEQDVQTGFSKAPINGLVVRLLGNKAEQLHACLKKIAALVSTVHSPNLNRYAR
jgi:urease accessory protein